MARHIGPKIKPSRRFGEALTTKAEKHLAKRPYRAGQHGQNPMRSSEFGTQLREKQKAKAIYGVMEKQFRLYYQKASKKVGNTGSTLLQMLEMRMDNIVYRLGFGITRAQARQLVNHGFFEVNGKKMDIPSYATKVGDVIKVRDSKKKSAYMTNLAPALAKHNAPEWLQLDAQDMTGKVLSTPSAEQLDMKINTQLIVEHYSR
jgi:small subunit ribosomal protein S4